MQARPLDKVRLCASSLVCDRGSRMRRCSFRWVMTRQVADDPSAGSVDAPRWLAPCKRRTARISLWQVAAHVFLPAPSSIGGLETVYLRG
ncbi:uncharacterized protein SCHCODRAFT_02605612 [Schizophyllum commune H4-8]|uniref:uncharacterized protein n=1 Tax=Schizophyllum commune (strain H4-8 / FGSC 9210) TaxID=578458 RepID=UPI00215F611B|nr:uncharacterized protein SCHCODRAFT_02605612 [Schizophyllum commune H4-8]KAI5899606.1 hypothetical protein SCHCODRAFT_02605612 [Schizophyllum commune H4-8]